MYFVYLSGMQSFSPSLGKDSPICSCFSSPFSVRLYGICYISGILVPCCAVVSRLFLSILVIFFFRFWLRLKTTSRWVGSECSCHWCCLPRRWFAVDSLYSSWFSRSDFWWTGFIALFHSSRMAPRFVDFILSLFISLFSHLVAPFIADHVSGGSPFVRLEGCLWSQA